MDLRKKIGIIYGPEFHDNWVDGTYRGFRKIGVDVSVLHCNQPVSSNPAQPGSRKTRILAVIKAWVQKMDRAKILKKMVYFSADIRLFLKGIFMRIFHPYTSIFIVYVWITPKSVWVTRFFHWVEVRQYFWEGDPPLKHLESWPFFPYLDRIGMVDADWEIPLNYKEKFEVLAFGGDETLFKPIETDFIDEKFQADVSFVGLFSNERAEILSKIKGVNLKIYGYGWNGTEETYGFLPEVIRGPLTTADVNEVFRGSKISIGTLHTGMTSRRLFDIASAGGFQISEYRSITPGLFGESIPLFRDTREMLDLIDIYLKDDKKRKMLAVESHKIFLERHTFAKRAKSILSSLKL